MADSVRVGESLHEEGTVLARPSLRINFGRLVLYLGLIIGAVLAIVPFFWMVSTSWMTLGETINRQWLPTVPQRSN